MSHIWLPPGCKSTNVHDNGYGIYDLWDLGEFEAKGSRRTKWGVREELDDLCKEANRLGIAVLWDAVLNHKAAADGKETSNGIKVDPRGQYLRRLHDFVSGEQRPTKSLMQIETGISLPKRSSRLGRPSIFLLVEINIPT